MKKLQVAYVHFFETSEIIMLLFIYVSDLNVEYTERMYPLEW